ncbi:MAG: protein kinase [Planctomycetes bacterium]|nr:protein kinase [Planctomycetota bacterium]
MAKPPHRPKPPDVKREALKGETARPADSVPVSTGPFTILPTQFGRYRIEKLLGKGAMGAVYLAHDTQLDRQVALKVARVAASGSAKLIQRMEQEAKSAAKIDHSQICKVYDFGEIDGIRFIALQYIEGEDLKTYLRRVGRKREPAEAVKLVLQIALALEAAHDKGVIHRDLKPENIMLRKGEPVIMDFGLARRATGATDAGLTQGMIVGTAAYMSPEQAVGKAEGIDHRSDLYALGVMLFEMLTGDWPFSGTAFEVMGKKCIQDPPSPLEINSSLSPQLAAICHRMIARTREDRFSTCAELVAALKTCQSTSSTTSVIAAPAASPVAVPIGSPTTHEEKFLSFTPDEPVRTRKKSRRNPPSRTSAGSAVVQWWHAQAAAMRWLMAGGLGLSIILGAVLIFTNGRAVVKIRVLSDDVQVTFQGNDFTVASGDRKFTVTPGSAKLHIKSGDVEYDTETFVLNRGANPVLTVEQDNSDIVTKLGDREVHRQSLTVSTSRQPSGMPRSPAIPADAVTFQNKRFKLFAGPFTWHEASKKCQELGGRLAEVRSAAENEFLLRMAIERVQPALWLGATNDNREGNWLWHDGAGLIYNNFANDQPDHSVVGQSYLVMMVKAKPGSWCNQFPKSVEWTPGFVCEWDVPATKQTFGQDSPNTDAKSNLTDLDFVAVGKWIRAVHATTVLPDPTRMNFQNEVLTLDRTTLKLANVNARNVIIRADVRKVNGANINLWLRDSSTQGAYIGVFNGKSDVEVGSWRNNAFASIAGEKISRASTTDAFVNVAFSAIGDTLSLFIDGKRAINAFVNDPQRSGDVVLGAFNSRYELKNVEYQILDPALTTTSNPRLTQVSELNNGAAHAGAWLSADGHRIYWEQLDTQKGTSRIWQAERSKLSDRFMNLRRVGTGNQPTLTPDELQMVYLRTNGPKFKQLYTATRKSTSDAFGDEVELKQFGSRLAFNSPCISPDGLSLVTNARSQADVGTTEYLVSRRSAVNLPWETPQRLKLQWDPAAQHSPLTWLFLSADELTLLATHELDIGQFRVIRMNRATKNDQFEKFEYLSLPGFEAVYGKAPRYSPQTKELYLTATDDYTSTGSLAGWRDRKHLLWVINDVDLPGFAIAPSIPADARKFEKNSYRFYGEQLTWKEAQAKCQSLGGNLVVIDNDYENKFVGNLIASLAWQDSWIGISRNQNDRTWNTPNGQAVTYSNWSPGQPDNKNGEEHFGLMSNRGTQAWRWSDQSNRASANFQPGFVCEWNSQIPSTDLTIPSTTKPGPWKKLLNGKDLTGWTPLLTTGKDNNVHTPTTGGWVIRKDELTCETNAPGWLRLDQSYGDCEIEFDFLLPRGVNSGLLVRTTGQGKLWGSNKCEIQLENDPTQNRPDQFCGGIYAIVPPTRNAFQQNVWNEMSVTIQQGTIKVRLNKQLVVDTRFSDHEALKDLPASGYFGLFNFNGNARGSKFRNIRIREL